MRTLWVWLPLLFTINAHSSQVSDLALTQGRAAENAGNFKKAAALYRKALATPEAAEQATVNLSRVLISMGQHDEAQTLLTDYIKTSSPFSVDMHLLLADVYFHKNMLNEAFAEIKTAEVLRPGLQSMFESKGAILFKMDKYAQSIEVMSRLMKAEQGNWNAHYYRGRSYFALGQYENARGDFKFCAEQRPSNLEVQNLYAQTFMKLKLWAEAEKVLNYMIKVNPKDVPALSRLSEVQEALGQPDEMNATYKRIIEIDPGNMEIGSKLADAYIFSRKYKLAEEELNRQLRVNPGYEPAAKRLVQAWTTQKRMDLVGSFYKTYTDRWPGSVWATSNYVRLLMQFGNADQAEESVNQFEKSQKTATSDYYVMKAYIHYGSGQLSAAEKDLVKARKSWPKDARINYNLGLVYAAQKESQKAVTQYQMVPANDALFTKAQVNTAFIHETDAQTEKAIRALKSVPQSDALASAIRMKIADLERGTRNPSSQGKGE